MRTVQLTQGTPQWISWRREGVGGSDAPVVEGISPYRTMSELFYEKARGVDPDDDGKEYIFSRGHDVEMMARTELQRLVKADINPVCAIHDQMDFVRASLDGFHPTFGVLEIKLVGKEAIAEAQAGNLPSHHYSQMQHQFAVTGADVGQWFGHDGKKTGVILEVKANPEYIKRLLDKEVAFWDLVKKNEPPPLTDQDYLIPEDVGMLEQLRAAKENVEAAEALFNQLKFQVAEHYGHTKIRGGGIRLYKTRRDGSLSLPKIPEIAKAIEEQRAKLKPEYVESFRGRPVESWTVQPDKKGIA